MAVLYIAVYACLSCLLHRRGIKRERITAIGRGGSKRLFFFFFIHSVSMPFLGRETGPSRINRSKARTSWRRFLRVKGRIICMGFSEIAKGMSPR